MIVLPDLGSPKLVEMINAGNVGVLMTDTLYGIVARADNEAAVGRIFEVKGRTPSKPNIVLISDISQLYNPLPDEVEIGDLWPGKNSIILPAPSAPKWLLRDGTTLAYRLPADERLLALLRQTGPLVAPSANPQGMPPARTVGEAEGYFGDKVDFYVDSGVAGNQPSSLFSVTSTGDMEKLR